MYDNILSQGQAQEINLVPLVALEVAIDLVQNLPQVCTVQTS